MLQKAIMGPDLDFIKQLSNQILNLFNILLEIERIKKGHLGLYGFLESMQQLET